MEDASPTGDASLMQHTSHTEEVWESLALWPPKQGNHATMPQEMCNRCMEESESFDDIRAHHGQANCGYFKDM